ncbi:MAG: SGNH/GDSL hydrolase family protein [bacterium]
MLTAFIMLTTVAMSQPKPTRVIFFGDSITELGVKPGGYITKIKAGLEKEGGAGQYELIGAGISGNKVYDLYLRLEDDVLSKSPDVVVIYVGVNDVWHKTLMGTGTDADKFEKFYTTIIKKLQEKNIKLILCTPAVIGERTDNSNQQDGDLNLYSQIIRNLAEKYRCSLCDLRKAFLEYNLKNNSLNNASGVLTTDRVHLNEKGNQLVAELLLAELYKKGNGKRE